MTVDHHQLRGEPVILPSKLTAEIEAVWRATFLDHVHKRRSSKFRARDGRSAEQAAWDAVVTKFGKDPM